jgi:N-methylhydantoinase A/oxoprolinase/acetone carboxylase beta subunit
MKTAQAYSTASGEVTDTPIYDVADLGVGAAVSGPAIVAAPTTTIVLHQGDVLERRDADGFLITVAPAAGAAGGARAEAVPA